MLRACAVGAHNRTGWEAAPAMAQPPARQTSVAPNGASHRNVRAEIAVPCTPAGASMKLGRREAGRLFFSCLSDVEKLEPRIAPARAADSVSGRLDRRRAGTRIGVL